VYRRSVSLTRCPLLSHYRCVLLARHAARSATVTPHTRLAPAVRRAHSSAAAHSRFIDRVVRALSGKPTMLHAKRPPAPLLLRLFRPPLPCCRYGFARLFICAKTRSSHNVRNGFCQPCSTISLSRPMRWTVTIYSGCRQNRLHGRPDDVRARAHFSPNIHCGQATPCGRVLPWLNEDCAPGEHGHSGISID
jgi:hypothetical protein